MIEARKLTLRYGDFQAVSDVSFTVGKGEIVGFLGPNGAGKTSTLRMLSTYLPPTSGGATVAGFDILTESQEVRRRIGYLPENPPLYGELTVEEYLFFVGRIKGIAESGLRSAVNNSLERCFITDVRKKQCQYLSKGYRQRVGLAQAIIHDPEVLILDEPTSGLDPKQIIDIRKMISSLAANHSVLLSTHILPEVSMVCHKVVMVNRGRVVLEDSISNLTKGRTLEQAFLEALSTEDKVLLEAEV